MAQDDDKYGKPMELMEWAKKLEDSKYKIIKQTTLPDGKLVSTVWLGLNHNFGAGDPLIFETMVFPNKKDFGELDVDRYSTLEQAKLGHSMMVDKWRGKQPFQLK